MSLLEKVIKDCFTTSDGQSYDVGRVLWVLGVLVFCFLACWAIVQNSQEFDAISYGTGLAAVLAAGGAALGMKAKTEPQQ